MKLGIIIMELGIICDDDACWVKMLKSLTPHQPRQTTAPPFRSLFFLHTHISLFLEAKDFQTHQSNLAMIQFCKKKYYVGGGKQYDVRFHQHAT